MQENTSVFDTDLDSLIGNFSVSKVPISLPRSVNLLSIFSFIGIGIFMTYLFNTHDKENLKAL